MATYRQTRNILASFIDAIETKLSDGGFTGITVQKHYKNIKEVTLPVVVVSVADTVHERIETGSHTMWRRPIIVLDLFCQNGGQQEDLKDFLITNLKTGIVNYSYTTVLEGREYVVDTKTANGRVSVLEITDEVLDMETDKNELNPIDRHRARITLSCAVSKVEA